MEWTLEKPTQEGWYDYRGDLYPMLTGASPTTCNPSCRVRVHLGDDKTIIVHREVEEYDYERADGLWRGPMGKPELTTE